MPDLIPPELVHRSFLAAMTEFRRKAAAVPAMTA